MFTQTKLVYERYKYINIRDMMFSGVKHRETIETLYKRGFVLIEDYWTPDKCLVLKNRIDEFINKNDNLVQWDETRTDARVTGSENEIQEIKDFHNDKWLTEISHDFYRKKRRTCSL